MSGIKVESPLSWQEGLLTGAASGTISGMLFAPIFRSKTLTQQRAFTSVLRLPSPVVAKLGLAGRAKLMWVVGSACAFDFAVQKGMTDGAVKWVGQRVGRDLTLPEKSIVALSVGALSAPILNAADAWLAKPSGARLTFQAAICGLGDTACREAISTALLFSLSFEIERWLRHHTENPLLVKLGAGVACGGMGVACSQVFDGVKTYRQTNFGPTHSPLTSTRAIVRKLGPSVCTAGTPQRFFLFCGCSGIVTGVTEGYHKYIRK